MKRFIIALLFVAVSVMGYSQSKWDGFFKPVGQEMFYSKVKGTAGEALGASNVWLFRPAVELSAIQLNWNKTEKGFDAAAFKSAGLGVGYQHYIEVDGNPYNDFGFNALVLLDMVPTETSATGISGVLAVNALKVVSMGPGYNFTTKTFFILTGITYNF